MKVSKNLLMLSILGTLSPSSMAFTMTPSSLSSASSASRLYNAASTVAVNGESSTSSSSIPTTNIRLSVEEKARTVISVCTSGTLCTTSFADGINGAPFGSFVDYVLDNHGCPILLMNEMSMHTMNVANNPDSMVTLFAQFGGGVHGQDVSRCSVTGVIEKIDPKTLQNISTEDMDTIRMRYSIAHAYADQVMNSPKFAFYRINPVKVYFVGGFGVLAKWVPVDDYKVAAADILAKEAGAMVDKLNRDNSDDLMLTATHLLECSDIERIRVTNVDRLGMDIRVTTRGKRRNKLITDEFRIGFRIPVISVEDAKSEVLKVFQDAWEKANGFSYDGDEVPGSDIPITKIAADSLE